MRKKNAEKDVETVSPEVVRAQSLSSDEGELLALAKDAVARLNVAVVSEDDASAKVAMLDYRAVVYRLNGDTFFGCEGGPEAAGNRVRRHCEAEDGQVPMWGQCGTFAIMVEGMRVRVVCGPSHGNWMHHFGLHVIDRDRLFISPTGFRSHFMQQLPGGMTVAEAVAEVVSAHMKKGLVMLGEKPAMRVEAEVEDDDEGDLDWIGEPPPPTATTAANGQMGFGF